ncbi:hypothetical protein [Massilia sp. BJB1822]|uniref:hypothetical protein n=1 Tax=Massilia sp. BJB1822 TaxID=2744470 RepID=UPI0015946A42|nr:hypothetical protein [Massilia sp. BJB1822]NVE00160.1 hypothetical protein [Massilia sp. BJB1822]
MKKLMWAVVVLTLGGCASKPPELLFADGSERVPVNQRHVAAPAVPADPAAASSAPSGKPHENHL